MVAHLEADDSYFAFQLTTTGNQYSVKVAQKLEEIEALASSLGTRSSGSAPHAMRRIQTCDAVQCTIALHSVAQYASLRTSADDHCAPFSVWRVAGTTPCSASHSHVLCSHIARAALWCGLLQAVVYPEW